MNGFFKILILFGSLQIAYSSSCFRCDNLSSCISPSLVCNGVDNCEDGSDERNCRGFTLNYIIIVSVIAIAGPIFVCLVGCFCCGTCCSNKQLQRRVTAETIRNRNEPFNSTEMTNQADVIPPPFIVGPPSYEEVTRVQPPMEPPPAYSNPTYSNDLNK